jgi:peptide deformylase
MGMKTESFPLFHLKYHPDPILRQRCDEFDFIDPPMDPVDFAQILVSTMYKHEGIGLAANQIGVPYRIFAMRTLPENLVLFNPKVLATSTDLVLLDEACLSYPKLVVKIKRPSTVRVRYTMPNGIVDTKVFGGLTARCILHEMEHLDGNLFYEKATYIHKDQAMRRWKKARRQA